jgi:hypothetical protein
MGGRQTITFPEGSGKYFKRGMIVDIADMANSKASGHFVIKQIRGDEAQIAVPVLPDWVRSALHGVGRWLDWPNRLIFRRLDAAIQRRKDRA